MLILIEVGIFLKVLGYLKIILIYIVVGEIYGGDDWMVGFLFCFLNVMWKVSLFINYLGVRLLKEIMGVWMCW